MGHLDRKFAAGHRVIVETGIPLKGDLLVEFEERAAIAEFDGGLPRAEAEALAWAEIRRLHPQIEAEER